MLVIPEPMRKDFLNVQIWAENHNVSEIFHNCMLAVHLYGCDWTDMEKWKIVIGPDFAFNSFSFVSHSRQEDGSYKESFNGGLIYHGPKDSHEVLQLLHDTPHMELMNRLCWRMHT